MIQKNPFLKYMIKDEKKDIFHSSAYAKAQGGDTIGAASTEDFKVRVNINQNRQIVQGYRDSKVMTDASKNVPKAKTYTKSEDVFGGGTAASLEKGKTEGAMISNRGRAENAVISNRARTENAVISKRATNNMARAPQVPTRRVGISIK